MLDKHQQIALEKLRTGSILNGGVGSGKSRTAIAYWLKEHGPYKKLIIITTAKKRDTKEWEGELAVFGVNKQDNDIIIDSWNNIKKYINIEAAFFIFDEQRVVGSGVWAQTFIKITKKNDWILLTATPGDVWLDYVPVFIANGFYKNKTEFVRRHVVYNAFVNFRKVDRYLEEGHLLKLRNKILVNMKYSKHTKTNRIEIKCDYNIKKYDQIFKDRWNIFKDAPIQNVSELCYALRRVVNTDISRIENLIELTTKHKKIIIFYNFNYELFLLRDVCRDLRIPRSEWNGHKHENIPKTDTWIYLVQYTAGAEGWNCIETNAMLFYSQTYSYKTSIQAAGRIDRINTPFEDLFYYHFISDARIDQAIKRTLNMKKNFQEKGFCDEKYFAQ